MKIGQNTTKHHFLQQHKNSYKNVWLLYGKQQIIEVLTYSNVWVCLSLRFVSKYVISLE